MQTVTWRAPVAMRGASVALVAICAVGAVLGFATSDLRLGLFMLAIGLVFAYRLWTAVFRPKVTLTEDALEIRNGRHSATVPLSDVLYCRPRRAGLEIGCREGPMRLAPYPRISVFAGGARPDEAAELIMKRAEATRRGRRP
jgi:hypothetical protein